MLFVGEDVRAGRGRGGCSCGGVVYVGAAAGGPFTGAGAGVGGFGAVVKAEFAVGKGRLVM